MARRLPFLVLLLAVVGLVFPGVASASIGAKAENGIWGFDLVMPVVVRAAASSGAEHHPGNQGHGSDLPSRATLAAEGEAGAPAGTPIGRRGQPIGVPEGTNPAEVIGGREYGGHAIDQMQSRGVPPSAVENTIETGTPRADPIPGRTRFFDATNNLTVITDSNGRVVTVITGKR